MKHLKMICVLALLSLLAACGDDNSETALVDFQPNPGVNQMDGSNGMNGPQDGGQEPSPPAVKFARQILDGSANGPAFADIADINGDGRLDLIVSKFGQLNGSTIEPGAITVYLQGNSLDQWTVQEVTDPNSYAGLIPLRRRYRW